MPNFMHTKLQFHTDQEKIDDIKEMLNSKCGLHPNENEGEVIDFNALVPQAPLKKWNTLTYGEIEWRHTYWGTKWNAMDSKWTSSFELRFTTAWTPPIPIIRELSKMCGRDPLFAFCADEQGFDFAIYKFTDGELVHCENYKTFTDLSMLIVSDIIDEPYEEFRCEVFWDQEEELKADLHFDFPELGFAETEDETE